MYTTYSAPVTDANSLLLKVDSFFNVAVWVLISLAILFVVWNVFLFIKNAASDDRKKYQGGILWGIVGLAVILSIWGLVNILGNTFGLGNSRGGQWNASQDVNALMFKRGGGAGGAGTSNFQSGQSPTYQTPTYTPPASTPSVPAATPSAGPGGTGGGLPAGSQTTEPVGNY